MQWNLGSRFWLRKQDDIQEIVDQWNPDVMLITESNLFKSDPDHCLVIDRYVMIKPLTWGQPQPKLCQSSHACKTRDQFCSSGKAYGAGYLLYLDTNF